MEKSNDLTVQDIYDVLDKEIVIASRKGIFGWRIKLVFHPISNSFDLIRQNTESLQDHFVSSTIAENCSVFESIVREYNNVS